MQHDQETGVGRFFTPVAPDTRAPIIERDALKRAVLAKYMEQRTVGDSIIHVFTLLGGSDSRGASFGVWGSAELNQQMRKVARNATVLLRYLGKRTVDDGSGAEVHGWDVQVGAKSIPADVVEQFIPAAVALEPAIQAAARREAQKLEQRAESRQNGGVSQSRYADELAQSEGRA